MTVNSDGDGYLGLSSYRRCAERIGSTWPAFHARRGERLRQGLFDAPVEKVAENIVEDLLTEVLDWSVEDVNLQIGRADMVLSDLGIKRMVLELKRPGSLVWRRAPVEAALAQARRYADQQHVGSVAVSDGRLFYAADIAGGGLRDRMLVQLDAAQAPLDLWWVSVHGIYRPCPPPSILLDSPGVAPVTPIEIAGGSLRHPKYGLPARCFAYVGSADAPHTWKLPFLTATGTADTRRLPKAIQAILSNYRGARVTMPREAVGDVLVRLARAAATLSKLPCQRSPAREAYAEVHDALVQLGRLSEVGCCSVDAPQ